MKTENVAETTTRRKSTKQPTHGSSMNDKETTFPHTVDSDLSKISYS